MPPGCPCSPHRPDRRLSPNRERKGGPVPRYPLKRIPSPKAPQLCCKHRNFNCWRHFFRRVPADGRNRQPNPAGMRQSNEPHVRGAELLRVAARQQKNISIRAQLVGLRIEKRPVSRPRSQIVAGKARKKAQKMRTLWMCRVRPRALGSDQRRLWRPTSGDSARKNR